VVLTQCIKITLHVVHSQSELKHEKQKSSFLFAEVEPATLLTASLPLLVKFNSGATAPVTE